MKSLTNTTTGNIFNLTGILTHAGSYAGEFEMEAHEIFASLSTKRWNHANGSNWGDIMVNERTGILYAVRAVGELTEHDADCYYVELDEEDCPKAFAAAKSKIENY